MSSKTILTDKFKAQKNYGKPKYEYANEIVFTEWTECTLHTKISTLKSSKNIANNLL